MEHGKRTPLEIALRNFKAQGGVVLSEPPVLVHCNLNRRCKKVNTSACDVNLCQYWTAKVARRLDEEQPDLL